MEKPIERRLSPAAPEFREWELQHRLLETVYTLDRRIKARTEQKPRCEINLCWCGGIRIWHGSKKWNVWHNEIGNSRTFLWAAQPPSFHPFHPLGQAGWCYWHVHRQWFECFCHDWVFARIKYFAFPLSQAHPSYHCPVCCLSPPTWPLNLYFSSDRFSFSPPRAPPQRLASGWWCDKCARNSVQCYV